METARTQPSWSRRWQTLRTMDRNMESIHAAIIASQKKFKRCTNNELQLRFMTIKRVLGSSRIWMKQYWEHLPEAMSDNMILLPKFAAKYQCVER